MDEMTRDGLRAHEGSDEATINKRHLRSLWRASDAAVARREQRALVRDAQIAREFLSRQFAPKTGGLWKLLAQVKRRMPRAEANRVEDARRAVLRAASEIEVALDTPGPSHPSPEHYEKLVDALQNSCVDLLELVRRLREDLGERYVRGLPTRAALLAELRESDAARSAADGEDSDDLTSSVLGSLSVNWRSEEESAPKGADPTRTAVDQHARPFAKRDFSLPWMRDALARLAIAEGHDRQNSFLSGGALEVWRRKWQSTVDRRKNALAKSTTYSQAAQAMERVGALCDRSGKGLRTLLFSVALLAFAQMAGLFVEMPRAWAAGASDRLAV